MTDPSSLFHIYSFILFVIVLILFLLIFLFAGRFSHTEPMRHEAEKFYIDSSTEEKVLFPSLDDEGSVDLSVVVPAFNEENRLPKMLDECLEYLEKKEKQNSSFKYEIIVVDDGSKDGTTRVAQNYAKKYGSNKFRVLSLIENRGKGGAVKMGLLSSRGRNLLFADADGATEFKDLSKLQNCLDKMVEDPEKDEAIVVGSRAHLEKDSIAKRSAFRTLLMYGFHFLVWFFCVRNVKDTQCGFKLFTRAATRSCFHSLHINRWAFDVELLFIANQLKIGVNEVAVNWTEIEGSKVTPIWSWIQMGSDLIFIWIRYKTRIWKIKTKSN